MAVDKSFQENINGATTLIQGLQAKAGQNARAQEVAEQMPGDIQALQELSVEASLATLHQKGFKMIIDKLTAIADIWSR
tara:strand:+ start:41 stop:277 length:237 start_codon:yes stop_codon:yes gene_type:complete